MFITIFAIYTINLFYILHMYSVFKKKYIKNGYRLLYKIKKALTTTSIVFPRSEGHKFSRARKGPSIMPYPPVYNSVGNYSSVCTYCYYRTKGIFGNRLYLLNCRRPQPLVLSSFRDFENYS